jgi:hypothetical protein
MANDKNKQCIRAKIVDNHLSKWLTLIFLMLMALVGWLLTNASGEAKMEQEIVTIKAEQVTDDIEDKAQETLVTAIDKRQAVMEKDIETIQEDVGEIKYDMKEVLRRLPK